MKTTRTKLTRARSFTNEGLATMLEHRNFSLQYGEPLLYSSTFYHKDTYTGTNHLFVGGDFSLNDNSYSLNNVHIGPYYGGDGITVNNNPGTGELGRIDCRIYFTKMLTIENKTMTYTFDDIPEYHTNYIIDNSSNTEDLSVSLPSNVTTYYTVGNSDLAVVEAGQIKMYTFTIADNGSIVIETKELFLRTQS